MHERIDCDISDVGIYKISLHTDDRGSLAELWRRDEHVFGLGCMEPAMVYISATAPGVVRGPHEHKVQWDRFVFLDGHFNLYLWENREGKPPWPVYRERCIFSLGANNPTMVTIPPGVVHAYKNCGDEPATVINMPNRLFEGFAKKEQVDEIRWEDDPNSPFEVL